MVGDKERRKETHEKSRRGTKGVARAGEVEQTR